MSEILSPESPDKFGEIILTTMDQQASALNMHQVELYHEIMAARANKRLPQEARNAIEKEALYSKEQAAKCVYALPRAGKPIKGPSIRLAEIVKLAWPNCRVHTRPSGSREEWIRDKAVGAESAFRDLESNTTHVITVRRRITDSHGNLFSDDMIGVTLAAAMAIAERNVIFKCVPRSVWEPVYDAVEWAVKGDIRTFAENRDMALKAFGDYGVKPAQIYPVLGLKGEEDLTIEHMVVLRGMYTALKDGSSTVEEMFDPRRHMRLAEPTTVDLASKLKGRRRKEGFAVDNVSNGLAEGASGEVDAAASTREEDDAAVEAAVAVKAAKRRRKPKGVEKAMAGGGQPKARKRRQRPAQAQGEATGGGGTGGGSPGIDYGTQGAGSARITHVGPAPKAPTGTAAPKEKPKKVDPPITPRTLAEYAEWVDYCLPTLHTAVAVRDWWKLERRLRNAIGITADERAPIEAKVGARIAELSE